MCSCGCRPAHTVSPLPIGHEVNGGWDGMLNGGRKAGEPRSDRTGAATGNCEIGLLRSSTGDGGILSPTCYSTSSIVKL